MVIPVFINVTEHPLLKTTKADRRVMLTAAHRAMALTWANRFLPVHFTPEASHRYSHQARAPATVKRKRALARRGKALFGGEMDNVVTGRAMRSILGNQEIMANERKGTATIRPPRYFWMYRKDYRQPNKAAEVTRVADVEILMLNEVGNTAIDHAASTLTTTKTTKFGSP